MNYNEIKELTEWLEKSKFTAYSLTVNGVSISMSKQQSVPPSISNDLSGIQHPTPWQNTKTNNEGVDLQETNVREIVEEQTEGHYINSPIVGIYYEGTSPESPPFVKVGDKVKKGDVLCILEAMKVMNEITADTDGVIAKIYVSNGEMVEACMPLFRMEV